MPVSYTHLDVYKRQADNLQKSTQNNHRLTQQIIRLQEDERKNLARDIHDEIGQYLTAIHVDASAILNGKKLSLAKESAKAISSVTHQDVYKRQVAGTSAGQTSNAITENLSADQLQKLDAAIKVDDDGNVISSDVLKDITRSEQPIFITLNREHNLMIVRTSDVAALKEIENLVKEMDKPTPQVLLEMKVLELTVGDSFSQLFSFSSISRDGKHSLACLLYTSRCV